MPYMIFLSNALGATKLESIVLGFVASCALAFTGILLTMRFIRGRCEFILHKLWYFVGWAFLHFVR